MKYLIMAVAAGAFIACNEGPADRMEDPSDRIDQERTYETPEMSGDHDEMREPIEEVHPPADALPIDAEIRNDSLIVPDEGMRESSSYENGTPRHDDPAVNANTSPVSNTGASTTTTPMTDEGTVTAPAGEVNTEENALPADADVHNDLLIEPDGDKTGTRPVMPESDSPHHSEGNIDTMNTPSPVDP